MFLICIVEFSNEAIWRSRFSISDLIFLMPVKLVRFSVSPVGFGKLCLKKKKFSFLIWIFKFIDIKLYMLCCYLFMFHIMCICHLCLSLKIVICAFSYLFLLVLPKINFISLFREPTFILLILSTSLMFSISINPA